ncbi:hypothetical protein EA772_14265 [Pedobacter sp. G11]|uniref:hypothetical protein n=1 Tax=Pedobacter sp. G11 TaxID=2482728 RepID=UPI000F5E8EA2|nr:hypothetical protein [Pedobacter sp. G11]AZI26443.1 hypothetical protein EA772_14265 [Pedobacter sp. G11]
MDEEIKKRLELLEAASHEKKRDFWDKLQMGSTAMMPIVIAILGWYFTNSYNERQISLSEVKASQDYSLENSKMNVVQVQLIRDFSPQLTGSDATGKDVAIAALLYAAPALGKSVADIFARKNPGSGSVVADIYQSKRRDLITSLFSKDPAKRLEAYGEISNSWQSDDKFLSDLIGYCEKWQKTKNELIDVNNGLYNSIIVFNGFPLKIIKPFKKRIKEILAGIPSGSTKTLKTANELEEKLSKL